MKSSISFPVKPHIKKFLQFHFSDKFVYSNASILAPIIRSAVSSNHKTRGWPEFKTDCFYDVELSAYYISVFGVVYNNNQMFSFNNEVECLFREQIYSFMLMNKNIYDIKYRETLRDVLKTYNITEDDIKFESLLRDFTRKNDADFTNRQNAKKKICQKIAS